MLSALILIPLIGVLAISLWPGKLEPKVAKTISFVTLGLTLVLGNWVDHSV
jgi:NADH:ubiquinone oxidoreductase subunit 4 (subunit M)